MPVLSKVLPLSSWAALPPVQGLCTVVGAYVIWRWFDLPVKVERAASVAESRLADAGHERSDPLRRPQESVANEEPASSPSEELPLDTLSTDFAPDQQLLVVLAVGLGYSVKVRWRGVLYGAGVAMALLAASRASHGSSLTVLAYLIVTGLCCFALVGQLQIFLQRWTQTATQQALLHLTPRWPEPRSIKRAVLASTVVIQRGSVAVWAACSAVAAILGCDRSNSVARRFHRNSRHIIRLQRRPLGRTCAPSDTGVASLNDCVGTDRRRRCGDHLIQRTCS